MDSAMLMQNEPNSGSRNLEMGYEDVEAGYRGAGHEVVLADTRSAALRCQLTDALPELRPAVDSWNVAAGVSADRAAISGLVYLPPRHLQGRWAVAAGAEAYRVRIRLWQLDSGQSGLQTPRLPQRCPCRRRQFSPDGPARS